MFDGAPILPEYLAAQVAAEREAMDQFCGPRRSGRPRCSECGGAGHFADEAPARYPGAVAAVTRCDFCDGTGRARLS